MNSKNAVWWIRYIAGITGWRLILGLAFVLFLWFALLICVCLSCNPAPKIEVDARADSLGTEIRFVQIIDTSRVDISDWIRIRDGRDGSQGPAGIRGEPGRDGTPAVPCTTFVPGRADSGWVVMVSKGDTTIYKWRVQNGGVIVAMASDSNTVLVSWHPNTESDLVGYKIYWSNGDKTEEVRTDKTEVEVKVGYGLYAFWATAWDKSGNESATSDTIMVYMRKEVPDSIQRK